MELFNKAKDILNSVNLKTGDFINDQKCNIKIAKVCAELKRNYEKLGRLSFRKIKGVKVDDAVFDATIDNIEILKLELDALRNGEFYNDSVVFENGELVEGEIKIESED